MRDPEKEVGAEEGSGASRGLPCYIDEHAHHVCAYLQPACTHLSPACPVAPVGCAHDTAPTSARHFPDYVNKCMFTPTGAKPSTSGVSQATNAMETLGYTGAVAPSGLRAELDLRKASGSMSVAGAGTENRLEPVLEGSEERVMGSKCGSSGSRLISFVKSQLFQGETEEQGHEQASK